MVKKKVGVIGVGGQTGTMFAFELGKVAEVLGIGKEIEIINKKKLFVQRENAPLGLFEGKVVVADQFDLEEFFPEIIFLTTKNPVTEAVKFYYQKIKDYNQSTKRLPTLILSQNGIVAGKDAIVALKEIFGPDYEKIRVARLVLFNPIEKKEFDNQIHIIYSLPIRVAFGKISGPGSIKDIIEIFERANFKAEEFSPEKVRNMEFSKLFLNLIGMASATQGFSISQGFKKSNVFKEEVLALKEFIKVVKASKGEFLNFSDYPVKLITDLLETFPIEFMTPFRERLSGFISKSREGKAKNLAETKYYNGAVVDLSKEFGINTPINQKILERALKTIGKKEGCLSG